MTYLLPVRDVTGNAPVRSVYTVPFVSAERNAMKTSSVFISGVGAISSSTLSESVSLADGLIFFRRQSRWPFAVAIVGCKCFDTSVAFIPGHVMK